MINGLISLVKKRNECTFWHTKLIHGYTGDAREQYNNKQNADEKQLRSKTRNAAKCNTNDTHIAIN